LPESYPLTGRAHRLIPHPPCPRRAKFFTHLRQRPRGLTGGGVVCVSPRAWFRGDAEVVAFLNEHATTATVEWLRGEA